MLKPGSAGAGGDTGREESCPYLGLEGDRTSFCREPSPRHRCYLWMERSRIDLTHQARFCLTDSHAVCPWLSIHAPLHARLDSAILPFWDATRSVTARSTRWIVAIATAFWIWLRTVLWVRLSAAMGRGLRSLRSRGRRALLGFGQLALRLGVWARGLAVRVGAGVQKLRGRPSLPTAPDEPTASDEPAPTNEPADLPAAQEISSRTPDAAEPVEHGALALRGGSREVAAAPYVRVTQLDRGSKDGRVWQCDACETINTGPLRVCRACGRPSPQVEEELMSAGDEFLAEGLAGLKAGNEELAYGYFVKACEASPGNELAWHWRAKTAPTLDEVIRCLEQLIEINPANAKAQADLKWALQRREREQAQPEQTGSACRTKRPAAAAHSWKAAVGLRRFMGELRWWLLQVAGLCAFALALALMVPYVLLMGPPDRPELGRYLALLPAVELPELTVRAPDLPALDVGPALPLLLGLLLLHAAFKVAGGGGLGVRVWMALLAAAAGWLMLAFGTNPPAPWYAAALAVLAVVSALAGGMPGEITARQKVRSAS